MKLMEKWKSMSAIGKAKVSKFGQFDFQSKLALSQPMNWILISIAWVV